ncbi:hypothetical protein HU200_039611 [Digitaria exilis]|uniref:Protein DETOXIFICATION n=1 Tax=Digitaria exilis TaxID=1010633 RepID=A0A835BBZ7_9POAL|nr:hypothetical protein HU200_039611 [Digitaria exilis]
MPSAPAVKVNLIQGSAGWLSPLKSTNATQHGEGIATWTRQRTTSGMAVREPLLRPADDLYRRGLATAEAKRLVRLAGPMIASCLLQNVVNMVSLMFVGHLGELPLAGASLANSVASVTGLSIIVRPLTILLSSSHLFFEKRSRVSFLILAILLRMRVHWCGLCQTGMATALDTLCGQAFGARQYVLLGVYKQRAMVVLGLTCVPIALAWAHAGRILVLLGQDERIAGEAGEYARWLIPSLAVSVPLQCHVRFLQAQGLVLPVMASSAATALCHLAVCWALVFKAGMGSKGAALSNAVSYAANTAMLAMYVRLSRACRETWSGFSMEAFRELRRFADLAAPSALMICLEWWAFEILVLLSGLLPNPQLETSVLSICLNTGILLFMIPLGLSSAVSTRVSNELGAGQPQAAKLATRVVIYIALTAGFVLTLAMTLVRGVWGYMYSNEQEVVAYIARMLPVLGISFFIDGLHGSLSGVLTGCGKQKIGAAVNLGAFYLAGLPMAVLLAFVLNLNGMVLPHSSTSWPLARHRLRQPHQAAVACICRVVHRLEQGSKSRALPLCCSWFAWFIDSNKVTSLFLPVSNFRLSRRMKGCWVHLSASSMKVSPSITW